MSRRIGCGLLLLLLSSGIFAQTSSGTNGEVYVSSPPAPHASAGVLLLAKSGTPDVLAKLGSAAATTDFTVFDSADLPLFTVTGDRKIGVGTRTPLEAFHLIKDAAALSRLRMDNANTAGGLSLLFTDGSASRAELASYGSTSAKANQLQLWNYGGGALIVGLNDPASTAGNKNIERLRINPNGTVGIGTDAPAHRLQVFNATEGMAAIHGSSSTVANDRQTDTGVMAYATQTVPAGIQNAGSVTGLRARGLLSGAGRVDDTYGAYVESGLVESATGSVLRARGLVLSIGPSAGVVDTGYAMYISSVAAKEAYGVYITDLAGTTSAFGVYQGGANDKNYFAGNVGIGVKPTARALEVVGDANFSGTVTGGNIRAKFQDVAEWVPASHDLAPGTVVVLNTARENEVTMSSSAYDSTVAGVVSAQPGLSLGEEGEGKEQIATTGRVKVRVDARRAPVRVGDLLVTSDTPGTAMRSEPVAINGRRFHQPGTIIGKALQPLESGVGEILVLLSMQ